VIVFLLFLQLHIGAVFFFLLFFHLRINFVDSFFHPQAILLLTPSRPSSPAHPWCVYVYLSVDPVLYEASGAG